MKFNIVGSKVIEFELLRPVHTRHNLNAYLIRYWMMRIKYALVPSTLLKKQVNLSNL